MTLANIAPVAPTTCYRHPSGVILVPHYTIKGIWMMPGGRQVTADVLLQCQKVTLDLWERKQ